MTTIPFTAPLGSFHRPNKTPDHRRRRNFSRYLKIIFNQPESFNISWSPDLFNPSLLIRGKANKKRERIFIRGFVKKEERKMSEGGKSSRNNRRKK